MAEVRELAARLAKQAPIAMRYVLSAVNQGLEMPIAEACVFEATLFGLVASTDDMREGTRAFLEKRKPEFKGRVGLYAGTNAYTQYFIPLLARLEGGNERNTDGAFGRLRELAPAVPTFPASPAELDNLIKQGEVWIAVNGSSRVYELQAAGFPTDFVHPKEGAVIFGNWFDVLKGAPHPEAAQDLVNFLIGVTAQEAFARNVFFAPINRATRLDPAVAAKVPYGQEQIGRMIKLDFEAMNDNVARWTERFNKEIERR
jgi:putative spermidine/putrescine transport system substrate-binding protein